MAIMYKLRTIVDDLEFLKNKCEVVSEIDDNIIYFLDKMLEFMYENKCIGLAAIQLGILKRLAVVDLQENGVKSPMFFINPEIVEKSDIMVDSKESSPTVLGESITVKRYETIKVKYFDRNFKESVFEADDLLAICLQHEIEQLDGKTIFDHCSKLKQDFILKKIKKNSR